MGNLGCRDVGYNLRVLVGVYLSMAKKYYFQDLSMRRIPLYIILIMLLLPSCSNRSGARTTTVVKPRYHNWWFNKKKDKHKKRTKIVRMRN